MSPTWPRIAVLFGTIVLVIAVASSPVWLGSDPIVALFAAVILGLMGLWLALEWLDPPPPPPPCR